MINTINYELNYRVKGKKFARIITIDFIPNKRHDDYAKIQKDIYEVQIKWNHIKALQEEVNLLLSEKNKINIEAIKEFKEEIEKATNEINKIKMNDIIDRRFKLLSDILIDNGYGNDAELTNKDFWDNCVEPQIINEFIEIAVNKDIDKKKQVH